MLTPADFVTALRRDGSALIAAAEHDLAAHVPSCPGWSEADLLRHTVSNVTVTGRAGVFRPLHDAVDLS